MMRGLPGSGKTTYARKLMENNPGMVRVNKDDLRAMLHLKWSPKNEKITRMAEESIVYELLSEGIDVIVDDTNMLPRDKAKWVKNAELMCAEFFEKNIETSWEECVVNDFKRFGGDGYVGEHVIRDMAMRTGLMEEVDTVIFDIDGTLADCTHRQHYVQGEGKKDWSNFFKGMGEDTPRTEIIELLKQKDSEGNRIILVSGRPDDYREVTEKWLEDNGVDYFHLLMRKAGDSKPDTEVKKQILEKYFADRSKIKLVVDDRPSVIRMWRDEGLEVMDVGNGVEF